jgi:hypothetical protein
MLRSPDGFCVKHELYYSSDINKAGTADLGDCQENNTNLWTDSLGQVYNKDRHALWWDGDKRNKIIFERLKNSQLIKKNIFSSRCNQDN